MWILFSNCAHISSIPTEFEPKQNKAKRKTKTKIISFDFMRVGAKTHNLVRHNGNLKSRFVLATTKATTTTAKRPVWTLQIVTDDQQHSRPSGNGQHSLIIITHRFLRISILRKENKEFLHTKYANINPYKCIRKEILIIWINSRAFSAKLFYCCYHGTKREVKPVSVRMEWILYKANKYHSFAVVQYFIGIHTLCCLLFGVAKKMTLQIPSQVPGVP